MTKDEERDEVLAMVAHEIRNPLQCIQGYAALMLHTQQSDPQRRQYLESVLSCSRWINAVTQDLADPVFVRQEPVPLKTHLTSVRRLVAKTADDLRILFLPIAGDDARGLRPGAIVDDDEVELIARRLFVEGAESLESEARPVLNQQNQICHGFTWKGRTSL